MQATEEDDGDADALTGTLAVIVTLSNFDEPPVISGPASVTDYPENSPTTRVVGRRYMATDPEGAGVTWSDLSGNDAGKFEFSNTGVLTFKVSPNFEQQPEYEVTLNAFDGGFTGSLTVTVTIADVNEPPVVAAAQRLGRLQHRREQRDRRMLRAPWTRRGATRTWSLAGGDMAASRSTQRRAQLQTRPTTKAPTRLRQAYNVTVRATEDGRRGQQTRRARAASP